MRALFGGFDRDSLGGTQELSSRAAPRHGRGERARYEREKGPGYICSFFLEGLVRGYANRIFKSYEMDDYALFVDVRCATCLQ